MIFTNEQIEAMSCFKTEYERIQQEQANLFENQNEWFVFMSCITKETGLSEREFIPINNNQKEVINSPLYKQYQAQQDQIKEEMEPMIKMCYKTLKENFHFVIDDIKRYGESIFKADVELLSNVYQNVKRRADILGTDISRSIYIYYLSEFYITRYSDIEIVIDAELSSDRHTLLDLFVRLLNEDEYINSILNKFLESKD